MKSIRIHKCKLHGAAISLIFLIGILPSTYPSTPSLKGKNQRSQNSIEPEVEQDSTRKKTRNLFLGLNYGSNSSFLGRYQAEILPYYMTDISYKSKTGFWLSLFAFDINNSLTFVDEVDVMGGWNVDLSKRVDASFFYTRYFFTESTELIKESVANTATASLGLDWSYVYTKITGHYIFGGAHDFFLVFDNSRYIEFPDLFRKDNYLSFEPKISIIAGTQTFVDTHYINQGSPLPRPPGRGNPRGGGGTPTSTVESSRTTFNVLSYEFICPVAYNIGKFSFELNGRYSIPVNLLEGDTSTPQFFFTGGVVYYISSK